MADRNNPVMAGTVGGDADPDTIKTVYIGVPDALPTDQLIRLQSASIASTLERVRFNNQDDAIDHLLIAAKKIESFIVDGSDI